MHLVAGLRAALRREIAVEDVLAGRTVEGIARRAEQAPPVAAVPAGAVPELSATQRRMWFVERLAPGTPVHNIAMAQRLTGPLDTTALRAALAAVAARHEVLRWRIEESAGVPRVAVDPPGEVALPIDDLAALSPDGVTRPDDGVPETRAAGFDGDPGAGPDGGIPGTRAGAGFDGDSGVRTGADLDGDVPDGVAAWLEAEARTSFDLAAGPLWRARLLRLAPDDHVLTVTAHHIVFDGWSQDVLCSDLARAYRGEPLDPLVTAFGDYAAWLAGREDAASLGWWADRLAGAPAVLDLPRDLPRPAVQTFEGASARAGADAETGARIRALAARLGATPYAVMLAAFAQVMRRLTGQAEMVVGTPVADRRDPAFEPLIGCLVQVLPVRLAVTDDAAFTDHVTACRRELSDVLAHLDVRLERLVDRLGAGRDLSRNPLIQVLFNMYDLTGPALDLPGIIARPLPPGLPGSLFDLTLYVGERGGGYAFQAVYNPGCSSRSGSRHCWPDTSVCSANWSPPRSRRYGSRRCARRASVCPATCPSRPPAPMPAPRPGPRPVRPPRASRASWNAFWRGRPSTRTGSRSPERAAS
nr:hypothetical protein GCM10020093_013440 [Planobispora longispora]